MDLPDEKSGVFSIDGRDRFLRLRDFARTDKALAEWLDIPVGRAKFLRDAFPAGSSREVLRGLIEEGYTTGEFVGVPDTDVTRLLAEDGFRVGRHTVRSVREECGVKPCRGRDFLHRRADWDSVRDELRDPEVKHMDIAKKLNVSAISVQRRRARMVAAGMMPSASWWSEPGKRARSEHPAD